MEEQHIVHVSMREFLRSGQFGPFRLGDSVESLRNAFGEPHNVGHTSRHRTPHIWKYGDIEFHVAPDTKRVWLIYCDTFEQLEFSPETSFDPWFFEAHRSVESIKQELEGAGLVFCRKNVPHNPTDFLLRLTSGVELMFSYDNNSYTWSGVPVLFGFQYADKGAT